MEAVPRTTRLASEGRPAGTKWTHLFIKVCGTQESISNSDQWETLFFSCDPSQSAILSPQRRNLDLSLKGSCNLKQPSRTEMLSPDLSLNCRWKRGLRLDLIVFRKNYAFLLISMETTLIPARSFHALFGAESIIIPPSESLRDLLLI